jgi:hypothetical protein
MDEVVPADGKKVTVSADHNNLQLGICQLHAGSKSQTASVRCMKGIRVRVACRSTDAADAGNNDKPVQIHLQFVQSMHKTV